MTEQYQQNCNSFYYAINQIENKCKGDQYKLQLQEDIMYQNQQSLNTDVFQNKENIINQSIQYIEDLNRKISEDSDFLVQEEFQNFMQILPKLKNINGIYFSVQFQAFRQNLIYSIFAQIQKDENQKQKNFDLLLLPVFVSIYTQFMQSPSDKQLKSQIQLIVDFALKNNIYIQTQGLMDTLMENIDQDFQQSFNYKIFQKIRETIQKQFDIFYNLNANFQQKLIDDLFQCYRISVETFQNVSVYSTIENVHKNIFIKDLQSKDQKIQYFVSKAFFINYFEIQDQRVQNYKQKNRTVCQFLNVYLKIVKTMDDFSDIFSFTQIMHDSKNELYINEQTQFKILELLRIICTQVLNTNDFDNDNLIVLLQAAQSLNKISKEEQDFKQIMVTLNSKIKSKFSENLSIEDEHQFVQIFIIYIDLKERYDTQELYIKNTYLYLFNKFLANIKSFKINNVCRIQQVLCEQIRENKPIVKKIYTQYLLDLNLKNIILLSDLNTNVVINATKSNDNFTLMQNHDQLKQQLTRKLHYIFQDLDISKQDFYQDYLDMQQQIIRQIFHIPKYHPEASYTLKSQNRILEYISINLCKKILNKDFYKDIDFEIRQNFQTFIGMIELICIIYTRYNISSFFFVQNILSETIYIRGNELSANQILSLYRFVLYSNDQSERSQSLNVKLMNILLEKTQKQIKKNKYNMKVIAFLGQLSYFKLPKMNLQQFVDFIFIYFVENFQIIPLQAHFYFIRLIFMFYDCKQNKQKVYELLTNYSRFISQTNLEKFYTPITQNFHLLLLQIQQEQIFQQNQKSKLENLIKLCQQKINNNIKSQKEQNIQTSHAQSQFSIFLNRLNIKHKTEYTNQMGCSDIIIDDNIIIEFNGSVHYHKTLVDLRTQFRKKACSLLNYKFICVRDDEFKRCENKNDFIKNLFIQNGIEYILKNKKQHNKKQITKLMSQNLTQHTNKEVQTSNISCQHKQEKILNKDVLSKQDMITQNNNIKNLIN